MLLEILSMPIRFVIFEISRFYFTETFYIIDVLEYQKINENQKLSIYLMFLKFSFYYIN